jgi:hypothetical protein
MQRIKKLRNENDLVVCEAKGEVKERYSTQPDLLFTRRIAEKKDDFKVEVNVKKDRCVIL